MPMSKRYRMVSTIWKIGIIVFLIFGFFDPTMILFAVLSAGMSFLSHRRAKQAEAMEEMTENQQAEMSAAKRNAMKPVKGPKGAKKGRMRTRRKRPEM